MDCKNRKCSVSIATSRLEHCGVKEYGLMLQEGFETLGHSVTFDLDHWTDINIANYQDSANYLDVYNPIAARPNSAIILHDLCINPKLDLWHFNSRITHSLMVHGNIPSLSYAPMPIPYRQLQVGSFGLGRNVHGLLESACKSAGVSYEYLDGSARWVSTEALRCFIRTKDVIAFWYPECEAAGTSLGVRLALSEGAKVVHNDVTWFKDVKNCIGKPETFVVRHNLELTDLLFEMAQERRRKSFVGFAEGMLAELGCTCHKEQD